MRLRFQSGIFLWSFPNQQFACVSNFPHALYMYRLSEFLFRQPVPTLDHVRVGPLSPRHGASSDCGCREGLQTRKVPANVLNKQSRKPTRGWSPSLGVGRGANNSHSKKSNLLRNVSKRLGPGLILWHDLSNGKRTWDLVLGTLGVSIG